MCFDLPAYLTRIGLNDCAPTLEGLRAVQMAQLIAIPFESVQPFLGQVPDVSPEGLWTKLVDERKGGFCFEVNTLFGAALQAIGFESRPVFCRVRMGAAQGGARSHLAHIVTIGGVNWLADAGFGGQTQPEPVRLGTGEPQHLRDHAFRTFRDDRHRRNGSGTPWQRGLAQSLRVRRHRADGSRHRSCHLSLRNLAENAVPPQPEIPAPDRDRLSRFP